jgi:signal transduction histidine kinase
MIEPTDKRSDADSLTANLSRIRHILARLEQAKQQWESAADSLPELVLLLHQPGYVMGANRTVERWQLGDVTKIRGESVHDLLHPACPFVGCQWEANWSRAWQVAGTGQPAEYELEDPVLKRHLHVRLQPVPPRLTRGTKMKMAGFVVAVVSDVTDRKQLQARLLRTQRLATVGSLLQGIIHDLNNQLTPIMMAAGMLRHQSEPRSRERIVSAIESNARRASELAQQLLALARGTVEDPIVLQPRHLIRGIRELMVETLPKSAKIELQVARDLHRIMADPGQLHRLLLDLCLNAHAAAPESEYLLIAAGNRDLDSPAAAALPGAKPGPYVMISVGVHVPDPDAETIPEEVAQLLTAESLNEGTESRFPGIQRMVEAQGGFTQSARESGHGVCLQLYFPAVLVDRAEQLPPVTRQTGDSALILIADDEDSLREITREALASYDYRVLAATNGADAVALCAQHRHELALVLVDYF